MAVGLCRIVLPSTSKCAPNSCSNASRTGSGAFSAWTLVERSSASSGEPFLELALAVGWARCFNCRKLEALRDPIGVSADTCVFVEEIFCGWLDRVFLLGDFVKVKFFIPPKNARDDVLLASARVVQWG